MYKPRDTVVVKTECKRSLTLHRQSALHLVVVDRTYKVVKLQQNVWDLKHTDIHRTIIVKTAHVDSNGTCPLGPVYEYPLTQSVHLSMFYTLHCGGVLAWLSEWSDVQTCTWPSWCQCHSLSLAWVKSRLVLPSWYRLTWVVPDEESLNGCVCVYCI